MSENKTPQTHPLVTLLLGVFLISFFGGGLALLVNLFIPFLGEAAFPIIALVVMAELLVLLVVGKCMQVVSTLRSLRNASMAAASRQQQSSAGQGIGEVGEGAASDGE